MTRALDTRTAELIEQARQDHFLPGIDPESYEGHDCDGRYVLLERGHYDRTWVSFHDSLDDASEYALGQEYAEDWEPEVAIDRQTGKRYVPRQIVWGEVGQA